jgi:hypothetical protein
MNKPDPSLLETELELTTQELLAPFSETDVVEIHDVNAVVWTVSEIAAPEQSKADDTQVIELTPEQIDQLLTQIEN